jgi:hypothetical protein
MPVSSDADRVGLLPIPVRLLSLRAAVFHGGWELRGVELTQLENHSEQSNQGLREEEGGPTYIETTLICACNMPDLVDGYIHVMRVSSARYHPGVIATYVGILENRKLNR